MPESLPITLQFAAKNLLDKDTFSKSDPLLIVYKLTPKQPGFGFKPDKGNFNTQELFRTERVKNNLNPKWEKTLTIEYKFEEEQWIFIQVLDVDAKHSGSVSDQDFLGGVITTVGRIVSGQIDGWYSLNLLDKKQQQISVNKAASTVEVKSTVMPRVATDYDITCKFTLEKTKWVGSDTPYFRVVNQNGQTVHESDKGHGKVSSYKPFKLPGMHAIKTTWKFAHNHVGDDIGSVSLDEKQLDNLRTQPGTSVQILDTAGKLQGRLEFTNITKNEVLEDVKDSIIHQLSTGLTISAVVAIDFTGSNGNPKEKHSLHYLDGNNQYRNAIRSIIPIIDQYDSDGKYPVYGFGMKYGGAAVEHARLLSEGAAYSDGVLMCYESAVHDAKMELSGPTYFAPIINKVASNLDGKNYTVLVIFTDGAIVDMEDTISAVVNASYKPMSIIIVGIGPGDFGPMNRLDNDGQPPLKDRTGRSAKRDIVQFVPIRDCADGSTLQTMTLAELPKQIMAMKGAEAAPPGSLYC